MLHVILEGVRQPVEGRGRQEDTAQAVTVRTCCGWHGDSSRWIRWMPTTSSSKWVKAGRHTSRSRPGTVRWWGNFEDIAFLRMLVAGSRWEVMKNALNHRRHFARSLGAGVGHLVHVGRIHSPSSGHRDRGGADQCPSGSKGRVATMGCISEERISSAATTGSNVLQLTTTWNKEVSMCQTCGCEPCKTCGMAIKNGVCVGCSKPSEKCTCKKK